MCRVTRHYSPSSGSIGVGGIIAGNTFDNGKAIAVGDNDTGIRQNGDGLLEVWGNNANKMSFMSSGDYVAIAQGNFKANGVLQAAGAQLNTDGNVYGTAWGGWLSDVVNSKITTDGRAYPRRIGGGNLNFNWSGQGGQPSWLWGGNNGENMYVYNPSTVPATPIQLMATTLHS